MVILEAGLAKTMRGDATPTAESRNLKENLAAIGMGLIPLFPDIESIEESMLAQFSAIVPDDEADHRLSQLRDLPGVETAYKKPGALPAADGT